MLSKKEVKQLDSKRICVKFSQDERIVKALLFKGKDGITDIVNFKDGLSLLIQNLSFCV